MADETGVRVYDEAERKVRQHGYSMCRAWCNDATEAMARLHCHEREKGRDYHRRSLAQNMMRHLKTLTGNCLWERCAESQSTEARPVWTRAWRKSHASNPFTVPEILNFTGVSSLRLTYSTTPSAYVIYSEFERGFYQSTHTPHKNRKLAYLLLIKGEDLLKFAP
ncbi:hypothetical protein [Burkholderia lata]|uniref:hypothetical protein n=1 Tax=Burkholderia lata (strain ATCC 17760 / DSM 23089 / LMG 22485 / NCIMB 9086 / R18194 / 383) TaxID=482957 RepID=UPI0015819E87|nr:hypothetical protein [Burkholderia lata]